MGKKASDAQRAAAARYCERYANSPALVRSSWTWASRNKAELQRKARERMAARRVVLKQSEEGWAAYSAKAREQSARYRKQNAEALALGQRARRAKATIAKHGFAAWHDGYMKRHPREPQVEQEELPEWPESDPEADPEDEPKGIPPPPPESASYDERMNYFLDYQDPTTNPDYVPKPGQEPYFRRGKRRWD
ncbi:hypothetical protein C8F04DRAFT_1268836 [Mycena alexandri]|uniref:Uncharacterized protein n=1 Tax=Mycena alexandri TaxID=1745969 RepID=A0AAD6WUI7_9AGAR|nr:hypothetical protein C8F04DRAFT_1268836 [Mycena alexandri]